MFAQLLFTEKLSFQGMTWLVPAIILALLVVAAAFWNYLSRTKQSVPKFTAMLCKIVAALILAFCLLDPMLRTERPLPGENLLAVVVDDTESMNIRPMGKRQTRAESLSPSLDSSSTWQTRLEQDFELRRYAFDKRIRPVDDLTELDFSGTRSDLIGSIETLQTRFAARPVAGMLLFTDGITSEQAKSQLIDKLSYDFPIYPVLDVDDSAPSDIAIRDASVSVSSFELAPAKLEATIVASEFSNQGITVRLLDQAGETLQQQELTCDSDTFEKKVRFAFQPSEPGIQFVTLRAMLTSEDSAEAVSKSRREVTLSNNFADLVVNRPGGPFRILYVSGRPNWEFKFLRRALESDMEMEFTGLIRIAKEEPKFSFRDQSVESSNPLMAGFSDNAETTEQYDEPVFLRIGVDSEERLKAGFPSVAEELFHFDAIIVDDVEAAFFTQQQMLLLRQFVADRGGGLLMLGGQESFFSGGYADTPLGEILPIYLRRQDLSQANSRRNVADLENTAQFRLTREGNLEPWLRLRANAVDEAKRLEGMPGFKSWNSSRDAKPGATIMAELDTNQGEVPGLVAQRLGNGKTMAVLVGDLWRWGMNRETPEQDDLGQNWRQICRWLTNDALKVVEATVTQNDSSTLSRRITVTVRQPDFKPMDNAQVKLTITKPDGSKVEIEAPADTTTQGSYATDYWADLEGGYLCEVQVTSPEGEELPVAFCGWTARPSADEFQRVSPDVELLKKIASRSAGQLLSLSELNSFVGTLATRPVPIVESRLEPLWHRPWLVSFAIGLLCLEWGIRRWKGLA